MGGTWLQLHWGNVIFILAHVKQKTLALVKQNLFLYWTNQIKAFQILKNSASLWILKNFLPFHNLKYKYFEGNIRIAFYFFCFEKKPNADSLEFSLWQGFTHLETKIFMKKIYPTGESV